MPETNQEPQGAEVQEKIEPPVIKPLMTKEAEIAAIERLNIEDGDDYVPLMDTSHLPDGKEVKKEEPKKKAKAEVEEVETDEPAVEEAEVVEEPEEEEEVETTSEDFNPSDYLYEVKVGSETKNISLDELTGGYQRNSDYTQKTQALANDRRAYEGEMRAVQEERAQYLQNLDKFEKMLGSQRDGDLQSIQHLKEEDPTQYLIRKTEIDDQANLQMQAQQEKERVQGISNQEQQRQFADYVRQENESLIAKMPELSNKDKKVQLLNTIKDYGLSQGYSSDELSQTIDHRAILILDKARKYDEMKKQSQNVKRLKTVPKVLKAGVKQSHKRSAPDKARLSKKLKVLRQDGSMEAAASVFFDLEKAGSLK